VMKGCWTRDHSHVKNLIAYFRFLSINLFVLPFDSTIFMVHAPELARGQTKFCVIAQDAIARQNRGPKKKGRLLRPVDDFSSDLRCDVPTGSTTNGGRRWRYIYVCVYGRITLVNADGVLRLIDRGKILD